MYKIYYTLAFTNTAISTINGSVYYATKNISLPSSINNIITQLIPQVTCLSNSIGIVIGTIANWSSTTVSLFLISPQKATVSGNIIMECIIHTTTKITN